MQFLLRSHCYSVAIMPISCLHLLRHFLRHLLRHSDILSDCFIQESILTVLHSMFLSTIFFFNPDRTPFPHPQQKSSILVNTYRAELSHTVYRQDYYSLYLMYFAEEALILVITCFSATFEIKQIKAMLRTPTFCIFFCFKVF